MNTFKKALITPLLGLVWFSVAYTACASDLPKITLLATGGTIAGTGASATQSNYTAGQLAVESLLKAVPELEHLATIEGEQVVKIGSQDMSDEVWLKLATTINSRCANTDGFVITHGTDTMEETAYFLNLTVKCDKPIVMVGAMRPATALSADGPSNLYNAVVVAIDPNSKNRGVVVAMNETVLDARDAIKSNTTAVDTFKAAHFGPLGFIHNGKVIYQRMPTRKHTTQSEFDISKLESLPKVGIVYSYANASAAPLKALIDEKYAGIVTAGVGNGNLFHSLFDAANSARQQGILIVRSSRIATGATTEDAEIDDAKYGWVAAGSLNPQKARILLQLALTQTQDDKEIQRIFNEY